MDAGVGAALKNTIFANRLFVGLLALTSATAAWAQTQPPVITTGPDLGTSTIGSVQATLAATGGTGTYTWNFVSGALPAGVALRTDVPTAGSPATLSGIATVPGSYGFTLSVSSGGQTVSQAFTWKITGLTVKDQNRLPDAFVNQTYSYTFTPLNYGTHSVIFNTATGLPAGMSLSAAGVLSGPPSAPGFYNINYSFTDQTNGDSCYRTAQLQVSNLQFTSPAILPNATQGAAYSYTIHASGGDGNYTFSAPYLPNGLTINPTTGVISGMTTVYGKWNTSITVSDGSFGSYARNFLLDVVGTTPQLPSLNPYAWFGLFADCTFGIPCMQTIGVNEGVAPYTWAVTGLPAGMDFRTSDGGQPDNNVPGDLVLTGTPLATGNFSVHVTATDAAGHSVTQIYPLHVSNLLWQFNAFPSGTLGAAYSETATVLGGTGPYSAQFLCCTLAAGLHLSGLTLSGTPLETGSLPSLFKFTDSAGGSLTMGGWQYIAGPAGTDISINDYGYLYPFTVNQYLNLNLYACCLPTGTYNWTQAGGTLPPGTSISGNLLSGTPTTVGTYTFLVKATDPANATNWGLRQITVVITPLSWVLNYGTQYGNQLPYGNVGASYNQAFTVNGGTGSLTFSVAQGSYLPPGLGISSSSIAGTPTASGHYNFTVNATDGTGHTVSTNFTMDIYPAGQAPPLTVGPADLGTWPIGPDQIQLPAYGGNGTYSWSLTGGTLPPGMALRTDGPSWFCCNQSAGLLGVTTAVGNYSFTLTATSGAQSVSQTYTLRIANLLTMDSGLPDAFVNRPYSYTLTPIHADGSAVGTVTYSNVNVPPGMTFSNGTLSGTPTAAGYYNFNFTMSDGVDTLYRNFGFNSYLVHIDSPGILPNAAWNTAYSYTFTASGGAGPFTFSVNGLPNGLSLNNSTGAITGTITANSGSGPWGFNLTATDINHVSYVKTMAIDIIGAPPTLPQIQSIGQSDCTIGAGCQRAVNVSGGGSAPFTWSATGLPPGMGIRQGSGGDNGNMGTYVVPTAAELWGTPTQTGTFNIVATATDAHGASTSQILPLTISPLIVDTYLNSGTYNVSYNSTVRVLGGTGTYTAQVVPGTGSYPSGTALSGLTLSGTPVENGYFNELLVISDTTTPTHKTLTQWMGVFIAGANGATIQINSSDIGTFLLGNSIYYSLNACCVPSYTWTLAGGSLPPGNPAFTLSTSGVITGTPTTAGTYTFLVQAADQINGANFARRLITLTVSPMSITTNWLLPYGNVSVVYGTTLTAGGGTGAITWSLHPNSPPLPPGLSLNATTGTISGTPSSTGQYFIQVIAADTAGHSAIGYFTLNIYAFGAVPPLNLNLNYNLGNFTLGNVPTWQLSASGGVPPYTYSKTPSAPDIPGMRVLNGPPLPAYYPATVTGAFAGLLATTGTFSTSIRVTDNAGSIFDQPTSLTVLPLTILTYYNLPWATAGQAYSFQFTGYGGSGNYSWSANNLPAALSGFSFSGVTPGQLTGTPTASGNFGFSVTMTDLSNNTQASFGFNLNVNPFAITNNAVLPIATAGSPYSQTLTAPGCGAGCSWTILGYLAGMSMQASNSSTALSTCVESTGVTCRIAGTPTGSYMGSITMTATGSTGSASKLLALTVASPGQPLNIGFTSLGNVTVGNNITLPVNAYGGTPPYAWSVTSGSLPPGVSLAGPGETLGAYLLPGFTYLWGRAMAPGTYNFSLTVTDGNHNTLTRAFTWYVQQTTLSYNSLPINSVPLVLNTAYAQSLLGLGGTGSYTFSISSPTNPMPPGLTLSATGVVSGTPLNSGSYGVPIEMTDTAGNVLLTSLSLNIGSGTASTINIGQPPNLGTFQLGNTVSFSLNPSGGTEPYTFSVPTTSPATAGNALPPGCGLNTNNNLLVCQPMAGGIYSFMLRATDSIGNTGYKTLTVTFAQFTLYSSALQSATIGVPYSDTLPIFGNAGSVTWSLAGGTTMPPGLSITGNTIGGTPSTAGVYNFTLAGTDAAGAVYNYGFTLNVSTINITDAQALPIASVGVPYTFTFHATGGTAALTWSATGLNSPLTLSPTTGVLSGTPAGTNTSSRVQVTVTDGYTTYSKVFTLWIRNQYPQQLNFSLTGANLADAFVGQNYARALLPSGGLPPAYWTLVPGYSLPSGLSLATGASLSPSLIPNATYLAGSPSTAGLYTFDMIMTDTAGNQTRRTFTLNVSPMGIVAAGLPTATQGAAYNQQLIAVGGTPPYTFSYRVLSLNYPTFPPGITGSASGAISGTPTSSGVYQSYVTVTDSAGHTFTTSVALNVNGPTGAVFSAQLFGGPTFELTAGTAAFGWSNNGGYTYSLLSGSLPAGLSLHASGSPYLISGVPTTPGPYNFTVRATDITNPANYADQTLSGNVTAMMSIVPKSEAPAGRVGAPYSYSFRVVGGNAPYTFQESPLYPIPPGLTLSTSGTLAGTPQVTGSFAYYATVTDSLGASTTTFFGVMNILAPGTPNPMTPLGGSYSASVGTAGAFELDAMVRGGAPPYTWTVAAGSSLPLGLSIAPGSNGVSAYLVGAASTPGNYTVTLKATDAALQSVNVPLNLTVGPLSVTPLVFPNGVTGVPYTAALTVSGGTPPYSFALSDSDMPVGLTGNPVGSLSGTPQFPGIYSINVLISDSATPRNVLYRSFTVGIDRAGQAPAIGISPTAAQMNYVLTGPDPLPVPINITSTSAGLTYTAMVSGIPGASLSAVGGSAPGTLNLSLNTTGLAAGQYAGVVAVNAVSSTNVYQGVPFVVTVSEPPPCTYLLSANAGSVGSGAGTGSFAMATGSLCGWTATVPNAADNWITIASGGGTGADSVSFNVTANAGTTSRVGTILAGGQNYQVTQFGSACSLAISPSAISVTAAGGAATININSNGACPWTASGLGATPGSGSGSGQVQVTIPSTTSGSPPQLTATIAGQTLTVTQSGVACVAGLDAASASYGPAAGGGSVNVTIPSGCSYSTVPGPSWITVTSNASGNGPGPVNLAYTVAPNSTTVARSGALSIGGQSYQITQSGIACSVTVDASPSGSPFGSVGGSGWIAVTANGANCSWTAASGAAWASVTPSSGVGNATLAVNVTSNVGSASPRNTTFTIAGTSVGITESGITCGYALGSTTGSVPSTGGNGTVGVSTPAACGWSASSTPGDWVTITPANPVNSSGSGEVSFTALPNPSGLGRSTTFTVAGIAYSLSQAGAPCSYALNSANTTMTATGGGGSYGFTAAPGCSASAVSYSSWITVSTASAPDGSSGTVNYTVAGNTAGGSRTGYIQLPGASFTVVQTPALCAYSLNAYGQAFATVGGSGSVLGSPSAGGCVPSVGTTQPSIVSIGSLQGPVLDIFTLPYAVSPFTSVTPAIRYATITFGGQLFTVKQRSW